MHMHVRKARCELCRVPECVCTYDFEGDAESAPRCVACVWWVRTKGGAATVWWTTLAVISGGPSRRSTPAVKSGGQLSRFDLPGRPDEHDRPVLLQRELTPGG